MRVEMTGNVFSVLRGISFAFIFVAVVIMCVLSLTACPAGKQETHISQPPTESSPTLPIQPDWSKEVQKLAALDGHTDTVLCLAFSPDGNKLATGSWDGTAMIWNCSDWSCTAVLKGHTSSINSIEFSPDGMVLATGSHDNTARLWSAADGKCIATLSGHSYWIESLAFSPDGCTLATGSRDKTVKLWRVPSGECLHTFDIPGYVPVLKFSPDGKYLVCGNGDYWNGSKYIKPDEGYVATVFECKK
jgi:WD40 repeat protein